MSSTKRVRSAPNVVVFVSKERAARLRQEVEPRYTQRLSDQITTSFYEACRIGNLDAAEHLMHALVWEVARSTILFKADKREHGNDLDAVRARYDLELKKRACSSLEPKKPVKAAKR